MICGNKKTIIMIGNQRYATMLDEPNSMHVKMAATTAANQLKPEEIKGFAVLTRSGGRTMEKEI